MKIKQFKAEKVKDYMSEIIRYNNLSFSDIYSNYREPTIENYLFNIMEPLDKAEDYYQELLKHDKTKPIVIIGDYDCDGILGTVILSVGLMNLGYRVEFIIPDRFKDGYGMQIKHVNRIIKKYKNNFLLTTVDNGIRAVEAINYAKENNVKCLVTDHHLGEEKINADVVIDPWVNNDKFKHISGATVALKLIVHLMYREKKININLLKDLTTLAGITFASDCMKCIGENRSLYLAIEKYIREELTKDEENNSFVRNLLNMVGFYKYQKTEIDEFGEEVLADLEFKHVNKTTIDFYLVPVINAVNRVIGNCNGIVFDIISLFTKPLDSYKSEEYIEINKERKGMLEEFIEECHIELSDVIVAVVDMESLHSYKGISGLVASDLVTKFSRPALVGTYDDGDYISFSGRSCFKFDLFNALNEIKEENPEFDFTFGGHSEALGCKINKNYIEDVREKLSEKFANYEKPEETYYNMDNFFNWFAAFKNLNPLGTGFEMPKFYYKGQINYVDLKVFPKLFKLKDSGKFGVGTFERDDSDYLVALYFDKKNKVRDVELILSLYYSENGEVSFKIEKILNKDDHVIKLMNDRREKYKQKEEVDEYASAKESDDDYYFSTGDEPDEEYDDLW